MRVIDWNLGNLGNQDRSLQIALAAPLCPSDFPENPTGLCTNSQGEPIDCPTSLCAGDTQYFGVPEASGADTYSWTFVSNTAGASFDGGITDTANVSVTTTQGGSYTVQVELGNESGIIVTCEETITVSQVTCGADASHVSCNGASDGSITVTGYEGSGDYEFSINNGTDWFSDGGDDAHTFIGLSASDTDYTILVRDANDTDCSSSCTANVNEPDNVTLVTSSTNVTCYGDADGTLTIVSTSGTGTPIFSLSTDDGPFVVSDEATIEGGSYGPGKYVIKVAYPDGEGNTGVCEFTQEENITQPDNVTLVTSSTNITCYGDADGTLTIVSTSGTGTPIFSLSTDDGPFVVSDEATIEGGSYGPGKYVIKVAYPDGEGNTGVCEFTQEENITQPDNVTLVTSSTNVTCYGDADGTLTIVSTSGTGTPIFSLSTDDGPFVVSDEATIEGGSYGPGKYVIKVAYPDGEGNAGVCEFTQEENITQPDNITLVTSSTNVTCYDAAGGTLTIVSTSGTGTPIFSLSTDDGPFVVSDEATIEGGSYGPGKYVIKVAYPDGEGNTGVCEFTQEENITQPDNVTLVTSSTNVTCYGDADGTLTIVSTSGTGTPIFSLSTDDGPFVVSDEATIEGGSYGPGKYVIKVAYPDGEGNTGVCEFTQEENITQPDNVTLVTSSTNVICYGDADGTLTIVSTSGTGTPIFSLSTDDGPFVVSDEATIEGGSYGPGKYVIKVAYPDGEGNAGVCEFTQEENITQPDNVTLVTSSTNVTCYGDADGTLTIVSTSGTGTPIFSLSTDDGLFVVSDEATIEGGSYGPGKYVIKVAYPDGEGNTGVCEFTQEENITQPDNVTLVTSSTNVTCYDDADGTLTIVSTSGTGTPIFSLSTDDGPFVVSDEATIEGGSYGPGKYVIKVAYPDGEVNAGVCEFTQEENITQPDNVTLVTSSTNVTCYDDADGTLTIVSTSGTGTPIFSLSTDDGPFVVSDEATIEGGSYGPGKYVIKVAYPDGEGNTGVCEFTQEENITQPPLLQCSITNNSGVTTICLGESISLTANPTGGTTNYSYEWTSDNGASFSPNNASETVSVSSFALGATKITLKITDANLCITTCEIDITTQKCVDECTWTPGFWKNHPAEICGVLGGTVTKVKGKSSCSGETDTIGFVLCDQEYTLTADDITCLFEYSGSTRGNNKIPPSCTPAVVAIAEHFAPYPNGETLLHHLLAARLNLLYNGGTFGDNLVSNLVCIDVVNGVNIPNIFNGTPDATMNEVASINFCLNDFDSAADLSTYIEPLTAFNECNNTCGLPSQQEFSAQSTSKSSMTAKSINFTAYPVPYTNVLNIRYNYSFDTNIAIDIYDIRGARVMSKDITNYKKGSQGNVQFDMTRNTNRVLFVRLTTNRGDLVKKIISVDRQ
ncbi:T9SS type A sorting domain-containing protein [Thalassobellus suaedae]|uniref:T9SS type A sorting domain-containing protein n=1 Tax=Thalassobellus suaedae TaxID=3074124 RepID=A0ABY9XX28_9FLAO|nr:T9SS type A sorting domain-containing protein [Flavobacteriaceae bacterium HL-DH14]